MMISSTNSWSLVSASGSSNTGIREVFRDNFAEEEDELFRALNRYRTIAFDTEFPGTIFHTPRFADDETQYQYVKANVERTKLIQVGFTVYDPVTSKVGGVWQFNLAGFSTNLHDHAPDSIKMLKDCGIDFEANFERGIRMTQFTLLLKRLRDVFGERIRWVTFHGLYDVAYFLAALSGVWKLPKEILGFADAAGAFFTGGIYDLKVMAGEYSWMGLEKYSAMVGEVREAGRAHQAGSDSLLTAKAFAKRANMMVSYGVNLTSFRGALFGIKVPMVVPVRHCKLYAYVPGSVYLYGASSTISIVH